VLAQLDRGVERKLIGLQSSEAIPIRAHAQLLGPNDAVVGEVSSGTVSPSLGRPILLAWVQSAALAGSEPLRAAVRDKRPTVTPHALPFVPKRYKR
jgi:aminomethyltransferase